MPSLPELEVYRLEFGDRIEEWPVTGVEALDYRVVRADANAITGQWVGKEVEKIGRYGKWLWLSNSGATDISIHLGLTGKLKLVGADEKTPGYASFAVTFEGGERLVMSDQKKLGKVYLRNFEEIKAEKGLGPDLLSMSEEQFVKALNRRKRARDGLMDQKKIAGVGGKYADEILWRARLHPNVRLEGLTDAKRQELFHLAWTITETAIALKADVNRFPTDWLIPHRHSDQICPRCGSALSERTLGGSSIVYCTTCQPPPNPYSR